MLGIFSFIVLIIGAVNWFFIGLLQFDFVAGLFGSQASIFSRIVYVAVGVSAFIILSILIKNKGKIVFNLSKIKEKFAKRKAEKERLSHATTMESAKDNHPDNNHNSSKLEAGRDHESNGFANKIEASKEFNHNNKYNNHNNSNRNLEAGEDNNINNNSYKDE